MTTLPRSPLSFGLLLALASACATQTSSAPAPIAGVARPEAPDILVLMPSSSVANQAFEGLRDELGEEYDLVPYVLGTDADVTEVSAAVTEYAPVAVVAMNNPTLRVFRNYQRAGGTEVPVVALLASFLRQSGSGIDRLHGVIYEVPLLTSLVNLRAVIEEPVEKIGVIYRPIFSSFLEEQGALAAPEGFSLVTREVSGESPRELREAVEALREEDGVDAIWVLNDNALLKRDMLVRGWLPGLQGNELPVIVNVRSLLSRQVSFGTFAVLPDHHQLGVQAAQVLADLAANGWVGEGARLEYPVSVEKVLDAKFARQHLSLREDQLETIDEMVE